MKIYEYPDRKDWKAILGRQKSGIPQAVRDTVSGIIADVRNGGDGKVLEYVAKLDGFSTDARGLKVSGEEIASASALIDEGLKDAIAVAAANIRKFHEAQRPDDVVVETMPGVVCRQKNVPIGTVGLYIPGGTAPLFSTVLMLAIPASIAGCGRIVICTPAGRDGSLSPVILYTASLGGISEIYKVGGAVAVGAMAYGTETIPKVDKIFGPGNMYVMEAKRQVSQDCAIDMPAGPSEVMIIADGSARADFVAADFLSQLEHGKDSQAILLTTSAGFAEAVTEHVARQVERLPRKNIVDVSMEGSMAVVLHTVDEMVDMANLYAPEHLIIATEAPDVTVEGIVNAGSVFLGNYSTESAGDYASGTNHTLPTGGWAVSCSGVSLSTFMKKMTIQEISGAGLGRLGPVIERMAVAEGLDAHANAVRIRLAGLPGDDAGRLRDDGAGVESLLRENIKGIVPYSTARDDCKVEMDVYLDANENPWDSGVNRYPSPHQTRLKKMLSVLKGIPAENIFLGNGSDEAIDLVFRLFCPPGKSSMLQIVPTYGMYSVAAETNDVDVIDFPLADDFSLDAESLLSKVREDTKVIFLCSPNNPTGNLLDRDAILRILDRFAGIVVVDEAYIDFASSVSLAGMIGRYPRLIVLQTLSKAWGMAGLRIGLAIADRSVVDVMSRVKYPYNISVLAQEKAEAILSDPLPVFDKVSVIVEERSRVARALENLPQVEKVWPSDANFLLVRFRDKDMVFRGLMRNGIIVRDRSSAYGCSGCLRITIGTPEENDRLLEALGAGPSGAADGRAAAAGATDRTASCCRKTGETTVCVRVNLDRFRSPRISTGLRFFDHMLEQIGCHAGISLDVICYGDIDVDDHHSVEDVAIALGDCLYSALGDKAGIGRYGFALPMDDAEAMVLLDLGGRNDFRWDVDFRSGKIGDVSSAMFSHFFKSLAEHLRCNLHIKAAGDNDHHLIEGVFKAFARALKTAVTKGQDGSGIPSSKGWL